MKHNREDTDVICISDDSADDFYSADEDHNEDDDDEDVDDDADVDEDDDDDEADDDDEDYDDEAAADDDDEDYDVGDDTEEDGDEEGDSDGNTPCKANKRAVSEVSIKGDVKIEKKKYTRKVQQHQRLKKQGGPAKSETLLSGGDKKLFTEALNILRGGTLEELKLAHCKAYLKHFSLRRAGPKQSLFDRVQEHFELKTCGGMAKYSRSTFTINCTGDACTGDVVFFRQRVNCKSSSTSSKQPPCLRRSVAGRIVKESYGSLKQQHTFTVEVLWSKGPKALPLLYPLLIKGRNLYRMRTFRQRWANEEERKRVLQEKHSRGGEARKAREERVLGKRPSCSDQTRPSKRKTEVVLKREQTVKVSRKNVNASVPSFLRGKAAGNITSTETAIREGSMDPSFVSSQRVSESTVFGTSRSTKCVLSMKASFAGLLIGSKGRNIGAISSASGAKVQVCDDPVNPSSRLVQITGAPEGVQVAKHMVIKCFLDKKLPPPVVTSPGDVIGQQRQPRHNSLNEFAMRSHNMFLPIGYGSLSRMPALPSSHMQDHLNAGHFLGL